MPSSSSLKLFNIFLEVKLYAEVKILVDDRKPYTLTSKLLNKLDNFENLHGLPCNSIGLGIIFFASDRSIYKMDPFSLNAFPFESSFLLSAYSF